MALPTALWLLLSAQAIMLLTLGIWAKVNYTRYLKYLDNRFRNLEMMQAGLDAELAKVQADQFLTFMCLQADEMVAKGLMTQETAESFHKMAADMRLENQQSF